MSLKSSQANIPLDDFQYCLDQIKEYDFDYYLILRMQPKKLQKTLAALWALHAELSKSVQIVSEETIGLIRLQWWREGIEAYYNKGTVRLHPVIGLLGEITNAIPFDLFDQYIETFEPLLSENKTPKQLEVSYKALEALMAKCIPKELLDKIGSAQDMTAHLVAKYMDIEYTNKGTSLFSKLAKYYKASKSSKDHNHLSLKKFLKITF